MGEGVKKKKNELDILTKQILHMEGKQNQSDFKITNLQHKSQMIQEENVMLKVENRTTKNDILHLKEKTKTFEAVKKDNKTIYDSVVNEMIQGTTECNECRIKDQDIFEWETKFLDKKMAYEKSQAEKKNLEKEFE